MNGCCYDREHGHPGACTDATCMTLPKGKTCEDCQSTKLCVMVFGVRPENTSCDFFPRRFLPRADADEAR